MQFGRHSVLTGETVDLRVVFTSDAGSLVDTDALPAVYIYDESVAVDIIEAEILAATYTSALAGPLVPTLLSTGFYEYSYSVPIGSNEGIWHDVWIGSVGTVASSDYFAFAVDVGADLSLQVLLDNELILIELDSSIQNLLATATLGVDTPLAFSTTYSPLYASPDLVRLEIGSIIDYIPDDTLALMIHWSSMEADFISPSKKCSVKDFDFARTRFVMYDAALKSINLPGGAGSLNGSKKSLGDLSITGGSSAKGIPITSGGVDIETIKDLRRRREEWWRVVNAGACIVPGQGLGPISGTKGRFDPDRRLSGRLWENPENNTYPQPSVNTKRLKAGRQRAKFTFGRTRRRNLYGDDS
jgi:hypothetical protein